MGFIGRSKAAGRRSGQEGAFLSRGSSRRPAAVNASSIILALAFALVLVVLLGLGDPPLPYRRGQVSKSAIRARVSFSVVDEDATQTAREKAAAAAPSVYKADHSSFERAVSNLTDALAEVKAAEKFSDIDPAKAQNLNITKKFFEAIKNAPGDLENERIIAAVSKALDTIARRGAISDSDAKHEQTRNKVGEIVIIDGDTRYPRRLDDLLETNQLAAILHSSLTNVLGANPRTDALVTYLTPFLKPFLFYDEDANKKARKTAAEKVPEVEESFDRGDILVRRDSLIDYPEIRRLKKEQEVYLTRMPKRDRILHLAGLTITVVFLVGLFGFYTSLYEPRVMERRVRMVVLMLITVILAGIARFFVRSSFSLYLIPLPLFVMAVAMAYRRLFALGYGLLLAMLVGVAAGSNFTLFVSLFAGAAMGILALGRVASRPRPFLAGLAAGLGTFVATWGAQLLFHTDYRLTATDSFYGFLNGTACGALLTVLLPFIERVFNVTTDLSFLELADLNKPVLRRLALEAPGTYNHSLFVGNLADSAAQTIGAKRLLARVGGYYHDIGKLAKPDYFVENHTAAQSRHYNLSPTMSALVIISHVKDGVKLAKEYKLPPSVISIIRQHHGTTLVEYFYREAVDRAGQSEDTATGQARTVEQQNFRYPGPKPRTKEAAIVMLADAVESASRTITDPTPSKLEGLVAGISHAKLADGQFDECGITMADLKKIEISLTKSLAGIFHSRIKYPGKEL